MGAGLALSVSRSGGLSGVWIRGWGKGTLFQKGRIKEGGKETPEEGPGRHG